MDPPNRQLPFQKSLLSICGASWFPMAHNGVSQMVQKERHGVCDIEQGVFLPFIHNHLKRKKKRKEHPKQPPLPCYFISYLI